jgi:hypothetical protein
MNKITSFREAQLNDYLNKLDRAEKEVPEKDNISPVDKKECIRFGKWLIEMADDISKIPIEKLYYEYLKQKF